MSTNLRTPEEIKAAFGGLFTNRTEEQHRQDAAQLLSFRFLSEVERLMTERDLTKRQLASSVGTSASYITQLFRGDRLVNIDMLARFEQVLGIQFVTRAGESSIVAAKKPKAKRPSPSASPISARRG